MTISNNKFTAKALLVAAGLTLVSISAQAQEVIAAETAVPSSLNTQIAEALMQRKIQAQTLYGFQNLSANISQRRIDTGMGIDPRFRHRFVDSDEQLDGEELNHEADSEQVELVE